jgi:hypothetical protein
MCACVVMLSVAKHLGKGKGSRAYVMLSAAKHLGTGRDFRGPEILRVATAPLRMTWGAGERIP